MKKILLLLSVLLFLGVGCAAPPEEGSIGENSSFFEKKTPAPAFSLENFEGGTITLEGFEGTPLVINSWASSCPSCYQELDDLATIQAQYPEDVVFIAINRGQSLNTAQDFTDKIGLLSERMIFLLDEEDAFYKSIGGYTTPETIFVDKNGDIVFHKRGAMDIKEIETRTKELINLQ
jgi:thiol-disulfide isomerase/thioredoxin